MAIKETVNIDDTEVKDKDVIDNDIVDIDFKEIQKKRFRLDRDNDRVIELNISDLLLVKRLEEVYPKMLNMVTKANDMVTEDTDEIDALIAIDNELKELLNYAFDSDIADKACPSGSLYDPINGKFRFEYIIEKLLNLYENNFNQEFKLMQKRMSKHTDKYTKKRK